MATQNPEMDQALIQQVSSQQLGVAPQAAPQAAPDPRADPKADNPPTNTESATAKISPQTEGDKAREDAFIEVDFGNGRKEVMSSSQIAGLTTRYKDLNHKNATRYKPLEPAIGLMEQIMEQARASGQEVSGDELAGFIQAAIQGYTSKPQMGGQRDATPDTPAGYDEIDGQFEKELAQWEQENAVSVPPMYRNAAKMMNQMQAENQQMKTVVAQLLQQAGQVTKSHASMLRTRKCPRSRRIASRPRTTSTRLRLSFSYQTTRSKTSSTSRLAVDTPLKTSSTAT